MKKYLIALLLLIPVAAYAGQSVFQPFQGGTGTSTAPMLGYVLVGQSNGTYAPQATSTLGITGAGTVTSVAATTPTGLTVSGSPVTTAGTLAFSLQNGYNIPLTASTTAWNNFLNTPSSIISAGTGLSWSGNTLNSTLTSSQWTTNGSSIYYVNPVQIGGTDNRGVLTVQKVSTQAFSPNTDPTDAGRYFLMDNNETDNAINEFSNITLQVNPTGSLGAGRVLSDIRAVRQAANSTDMAFVFSAFQQGPTYQDYFQVASSTNWFAGNLKVGGSGTTASTLGVNGSASIGASYLGNAAPSNSLIVQNSIGVATTSPMSPLSVVGNIFQNGQYTHFGSDTETTCSTFNCVELWGNDGSENGVQMGVGNRSASNQAYSGLFLNNNLADSTITHYGFFGLNSSNYSDTTFGTALAVPNQMQIQNTDGPVSLVASTSTSPGYISFLVGGANTANEAMRIINNGNVGVGTTSPSSLFSVGNTNGINFSTATSTFSSTGGINLTNGCFAIGGTCLSSGGGGTPGGSNTQVQFNDSGSFGGTSGFVFTKTNGQLSLPSNGWYELGGNLLAYASSTNQDTIFGLNAGGKNATTSATVGTNTAIGYFSLNSLITGVDDTSVGYQSMKNVTSSFDNVAVGDQTLLSLTSGSARDTALGFQAGQAISSGSDNTSIGNGAGSASGSNTLSFMTAVGSSALTNDTGSGNTALGYKAANSLTSGTFNIAIGANVTPVSNTASGQLTIGNVLFGTGLYSGSTVASSTTSGGAIGVGSTTPFATFAIGGTSGTDPFAVATSSQGTLAFGIDSSGHRYSGGPAPAVSSCGTNPSITGDDNAGTITVGSGVSTTACTITFAHSWAATPTCQLATDSVTALADISSISGSALTVGLGASLSSGHIYYECLYHHS